MRWCLIVRCWIQKYLIKSACRVPFLCQVKEVRVCLLDCVTTFEGFYMLFEFLTADRYAATAPRVWVKWLGVTPSASVHRLFGFLREHLQWWKYVQVIIFKFLLDPQALKVQCLCFCEMMLWLLYDLHVMHLLVALSHWVLFACYRPAIGGSLSLHCHLIIGVSLIRDLSLKHAAWTVIRKYRLLLPIVLHACFDLLLMFRYKHVSGCARGSFEETLWRPFFPC